MSADPQSSQNSNNRELYAFVVALIVVCAYIVFYGIVLAHDSDYSGLEKVSATFGSLVAAVIGYYFGQRPVQSLTRQVEQISSQKQEERNNAVNIYSVADMDNSV